MRKKLKEINDVITTKHADYFLLNYEIIKRAVSKGGLITNSGRIGSILFYKLSIRLY